MFNYYVNEDIRRAYKRILINEGVLDTVGNFIKDAYTNEDGSIDWTAVGIDSLLAAGGILASLPSGGASAAGSAAMIAARTGARIAGKAAAKALAKNLVKSYAINRIGHRVGNQLIDDGHETAGKIVNAASTIAALRGGPQTGKAGFAMNGLADKLMLGSKLASKASDALKLGKVGRLATWIPGVAADVGVLIGAEKLKNHAIDSLAPDEQTAEKIKNASEYIMFGAKNPIWDDSFDDIMDPAIETVKDMYKDGKKKLGLETEQDRQDAEDDELIKHQREVLKNNGWIESAKYGKYIYKPKDGGYDWDPEANEYMKLYANREYNEKTRQYDPINNDNTEHNDDTIDQNDNNIDLNYETDEYGNSNTTDARPEIEDDTSDEIGSYDSEFDLDKGDD